MSPEEREQLDPKDVLMFDFLDSLDDMEREIFDKSMLVLMLKRMHPKRFRKTYPAVKKELAPEDMTDIFLTEALLPFNAQQRLLGLTMQDVATQLSQEQREELLKSLTSPESPKPPTKPKRAKATE